MTYRSVDALCVAAAESRDAYGYTLVPADRAAMTRYVRAALEQQAAGSCVPLVIVLIQPTCAARVVGSTRFLDLDYWSPPGVARAVQSSLPSVAEIGCTWLAASALGTGVNVETKLLMLRHAFDVWGVRRISLKTDARDERSRRSIERLGAQFEGVRRAHAAAIDGTVLDTAYYSLLAEEWPAARAAIEAAIEARAAGQDSLPSRSA